MKITKKRKGFELKMATLKEKREHIFFSKLQMGHTMLSWK